MSFDVVMINLIFLLITTILTFLSVRRIVAYRSKTVADYAVALIYLFNCLPVLMDILIGVPDYVYWYDVFEPLMADFWICLIYNVYIGAAMTALACYASHVSVSGGTVSVSMCSEKTGSWETVFDLMLILSPVIFILAKYGMDAVKGYTLLNRRGVSNADGQLFNQLMILSIYLTLSKFFIRPRTGLQWIGMLALMALLAWINGKRYSIVTILEELFYMYQISKKPEDRKKLNLSAVITAAVIGTVCFTVYYMTNVKITQANEHMYGMIRVDFGRDDVIKFVIHKILLEHEPILDYPGQTVLSTLLFWVPRGIWPGKPYPHYRYLTGAILNRNILDIPAGTTPSVFEMGICNFGWSGCLIAIALLVWMCRVGDRSGDSRVKLLTLIFLTVFLSQSVDSVMILIPVLLLLAAVKKLNIRFVFRSANALSR